MIKLPSNVVNFAAGKTDLYEAFVDYWRHYRTINGAKNLVFNADLAFDKKEEELNIALRNEIIRVANVGDMSGFPVEQWANHPSVRWASFAVVSALIDAVLPESIIDSIGLFTDVRVGGFSDSFSFEIKPRDIFTVTKAGKGKRMSQVQKQYNGQVTILPEPRMITTGVSLFKVLAGKESLAEYTAKAVRSMEVEMAKDSYTAWAAAMAALPNTATTGLRVAGYSQDALTDLCQRVTAWNGGAKAIVMGTARALNGVLPSNSGYRYDLESDYVKIGYIQTAFGYDLMALPQVADPATPFGTLISNSYIWIISPSAGKPIKLCLEGSTLSNVTGIFENADLSQTSMLWKSWGTGVATSAVAGVITL